MHGVCSTICRPLVEAHTTYHQISGLAHLAPHYIKSGELLYGMSHIQAMAGGIEDKSGNQT